MVLYHARHWLPWSRRSPTTIVYLNPSPGGDPDPDFGGGSVREPASSAPCLLFPATMSVLHDAFHQFATRRNVRTHCWFVQASGRLGDVVRGALSDRTVWGALSSLPILLSR